MKTIQETDYLGCLICPACGGRNFFLIGFDYSRKGTMMRIQCTECRRYFSDSITEEHKAEILKTVGWD